MVQCGGKFTKEIYMRLSVTMTRELYDVLRPLAREKRTDIGGLIEQGLRVMEAAREQRKVGRNHLGFVSDATKLDVQLIIV
jgi:hypothetical protein